jgi:hypothetical protein
VLGQEDSAVPKLQSIAAKAVKAGLLASIQVRLLFMSFSVILVFELFDL